MKLTLAKFFSQKVVSKVFLYLTLLCLLAATLASADNLANRLDPDQARQNVGPDLDPHCLTL